MERITTPARPDLLVGSWVRLYNHYRPTHPYLGVLTRAEPVPGHAGLWQWTLHTPAGYMLGGPHLPAQPLDRAHRSDARRARRQLARALERDRDTVAGLREFDCDLGVMPRVVAEWEHMRKRLNTQLSP